MVNHRIAAALALAGVCLGVAVEAVGEVPAPSAETVAGGNDSSSREHAKRLYEQGLSAYRAGKYSDAIDKLLEADQAMPNAAFAYNIGLVYEAKGDHRSALRWLRSYLRQGGADQNAALAKVRKLEAQLEAQGLQQVTVVSGPTGAMLQIDGVALGITPFTIELPPGSHVAILTLQGHETAQRPFELRPDRSMDVEVALAVATPETEPPPIADHGPSPMPVKSTREPSMAAQPAPAVPPLTQKAAAAIAPWTWVSLGVGTALLGGALGFEIKRRHEETAAGAAASQVQFHDHYSRIEPAQTAARVLASAGSVVLASGLGLLVFDLTRSGPTRTATLGNCADGLCANLGGQF